METTPDPITIKPDRKIEPIKISVPFPDEPGAVRMTQLQWDSFQKRLGEACAYYWCERAECYAADCPKRWAKYKDHYRTLLNWHQMKAGDGYEFFEHPTQGPGYYRSWVIEKVLQGKS